VGNRRKNTFFMNAWVLFKGLRSHIFEELNEVLFLQFVGLSLDLMNSWENQNVSMFRIFSTQINHI
jgi:hypothetical protein